jgi:hypothetical protein
LPLSIVKPAHHLRHHRRKARVGVVGIGRSCSATNIAIESFQVTGCSKVLALRAWELFLQSVVGNGCPEVAPQRGHSFRVRVTIGTDDFEVATEHGPVATRFPDLLEILQDLLSASLALFRVQTGWQANGLGNVAELVEETAVRRTW